MCFGTAAKSDYLEKNLLNTDCNAGKKKRQTFPAVLSFCSVFLFFFFKYHTTVLKARFESYKLKQQ